MKIKISSIIKWMILISTVFALSLLKPLGELFPIFYFEYAIWWGIVFLAVIANIFLIRIKKINNQYLLLMTLLIVCIVLIRLSVDLFQGRNVYKELNANITYFFILLTLPVYYILTERIVSLEQLIDITIFLTVLSYLLRTFISVYYTITHQRIFMPISLESAPENWFRDGILRINPPCFGIIIITLCMYRFYTAYGIKRKIYYSTVIALAVFYSAYIHYSRAALIVQASEIVFLVFIKHKKILKKMIVYLIFAGIVTACIYYDLVDRIIGMFSISNEKYWFSNSSRLISYPYYFNMFLDNFWIGKGFLRGEELYFSFNNITGTLSDVGMLRSLVLLGCGMLLFYSLYFLRGFFTGWKLYKNKKGNLYIIVWGITVSVLLTGINVDCFFAVYVFSVPFCLAIIEYARTLSKNSIRRNRNV